MKKLLLFAALITAATVSAHARTPEFFELAKTGTPRLIQAALNHREEVNGRDATGRTALMYAAQINDNPEVIAALLKAGADAKAKSGKGMTALDYAQKNVRLKGTDAYRQLEEASRCMRST